MVAMPALLTGPIMEPRAEDEIVEQIRRLLEPLLVETRRTPKYLDAKLKEYRQLKEHADRLFWEDSSKGTSREEPRELMAGAYTDAMELVDSEGRELIPARERRALISAIESRASLAVQVLRANEEGCLLELLDPLTASTEDLLKADMCIHAVLLVVTRQVSHWDPKQLNRLCRYADRYMLEVEDLFLAHHAGQGKGRAEDEETITLEQLEQELGLSA